MPLLAIATRKSPVIRDLHFRIANFTAELSHAGNAAVNHPVGALRALCRLSPFRDFVIPL